MFPTFSYSLLLPQRPTAEQIFAFAQRMWPTSSIQAIGPAVHAEGMYNGQAMLMSFPHPFAQATIARALEGQVEKSQAQQHQAHLIVFESVPETKVARLDAFSRLVAASATLGAQWALAGSEEAGLLPLHRFAQHQETLPLGSVGRIGETLPASMGGGFVIATRGLSPLVGHEVGLQANSPEEALSMMNTLLMVSIVALRSPEPFKEGDKVDTSPDTHRFVRVWNDSAAGVPVMVLVESQP